MLSVREIAVLKLNFLAFWSQLLQWFCSDDTHTDYFPTLLCGW